MITHADSVLLEAQMERYDYDCSAVIQELSKQHQTTPKVSRECIIMIMVIIFLITELLDYA